MIKEYNFNYRNEAEAIFTVDTSLFTKEFAQQTLDFFDWQYNTDNDSIDEVMKKYAIEAIKIATFNQYNTQGVISEFESNEGFCRIDGTFGITLKSVTPYEFDNDYLFIDIK